MAKKHTMETSYIVFNECTLIDRGVDSIWYERRSALRRLKKIIKNYLNERRKGNDNKFRCKEDEYLWSIMSSELSFKKLEIIYEVVEKIYNIDLKSMIYIERKKSKKR